MNTKTTGRTGDFAALGLTMISQAARDLYGSMGRGGKLRVPLSGLSPEIVLPGRDGRIDLKTSHRVCIATPNIVAELANTGLIHKLTEHGEPPPEQRAKHGGYRIGWREAGYDGDAADWWVCTQ
jgi:hypothetical protein